jgi:RNA polymerase sigma-70 factor (ECF subfamily)
MGESVAIDARRKPIRLESESALVQKARNGDARALARLLEIHYAGMLRLATKYSRNSACAHDALQDSCIKVMEHIPKLREDARFSAWMSTIVINTARIHHRKNRRFVHLNADWVSSSQALANPEVLLGNRQRLSQVEETLRAGSADDYQLFMRRYVVGQSDRSISQEMGLSVPAVKTRVHRARAQLRRAVEA